MIAGFKQYSLYGTSRDSFIPVLIEFCRNVGQLCPSVELYVRNQWPLVSFGWALFGKFLTLLVDPKWVMIWEAALLFTLHNPAISLCFIPCMYNVWRVSAHYFTTYRPQPLSIWCFKNLTVLTQYDVTADDKRTCYCVIKAGTSHTSFICNKIKESTVSSKSCHPAIYGRPTE